MNFTLTRDNGRLSYAQRLFYERNGFIVIPRLIPCDLLDKCSKRFDEYKNGKLPIGMITIVRDIADRKSVVKLQDILHDECFLEYFSNRELLDIVETFTGPNILGVHSMLIAKPPDVGFGSSRHPPHQDLYYFPFRPANKIVAAWTAIEKCNKTNGCLHVFPGSHLTHDIQAHNYPKSMANKMYHGIQNLPETINWVNVEMEPGDTVFFHPLLIHGSWKNISTQTRKSISCHYASADIEFIEVKGTVQELIEKELLELVKKRFPQFQNFSFIDLWKIRSRLMRGIESSL